MTKSIDVTVEDYDVEIDVELDEVLDESSIEDCLDHYDDADSVQDWLVSSKGSDGIGEWVAGDNRLMMATLHYIALTDEDRAKAIVFLGGEPKVEPQFSDDDLSVIVTALAFYAGAAQQFATFAGVTTPSAIAASTTYATASLLRSRILDRDKIVGTAGACVNRPIFDAATATGMYDHDDVN